MTMLVRLTSNRSRASWIWRSVSVSTLAVVLGVAETKPIRCAYIWKHHVPTHIEVSIVE